MTKSPTAYILDTRTFVAGALPSKLGDLYVTEGVLGEAQRTHRTMNRSVALMEEGRLKKAQAGKEDLRVVREHTAEIGEAGRLSEVDLGVAAAALRMSRAGRSVVVVTDDYALQNLLSRMKLRYQRVTHKGISREVTYRYRCSVCGKLFDVPVDHCLDCGSPVERIRSKVKRITRDSSP